MSQHGPPLLPPNGHRAGAGPPPSGVLEDLGITAEWVSGGEVRLRFPPPPAPPARRGAGIASRLGTVLLLVAAASCVVDLSRGGARANPIGVVAILAYYTCCRRRSPSDAEGWSEWRLCPGYLMASGRASQVEVYSSEGLRVRQVRPDRWVLEARAFVPMELAHSPTRDGVDALAQYVVAVTGIPLDDGLGRAAAPSMWERG